MSCSYLGASYFSDCLLVRVLCVYSTADPFMISVRAGAIRRDGKIAVEMVVSVVVVSGMLTGLHPGDCLTFREIILETDLRRVCSSLVRPAAMGWLRRIILINS